MFFIYCDFQGRCVYHTLWLVQGRCFHPLWLFKRGVVSSLVVFKRDVFHSLWLFQGTPLVVIQGKYDFISSGFQGRCFSFLLVFHRRVAGGFLVTDKDKYIHPHSHPHPYTQLKKSEITYSISIPSQCGNLLSKRGPIWVIPTRAGFICHL